MEITCIIPPVLLSFFIPDSARRVVGGDIILALDPVENSSLALINEVRVSTRQFCADRVGKLERV